MSHPIYYRLKGVIDTLNERSVTLFTQTSRDHLIATGTKTPEDFTEWRLIEAKPNEEKMGFYPKRNFSNSSVEVFGSDLSPFSDPVHDTHKVEFASQEEQIHYLLKVLKAKKNAHATVLETKDEKIEALERMNERLLTALREAKKLTQEFSNKVMEL